MLQQVGYKCSVFKFKFRANDAQSVAEGSISRT
jgi:hypothetical protein